MCVTEMMVIPAVVAVIDRNGMPLLILPSEDKFLLFGGMVQAITDLSRTITGGEIDHIRTSNGIIFIKPISNKGSFLMFFRDIREPERVQWIAQLFHNEVEVELDLIIDGFVTESDIKRIESKYSNFIRIVQEIGQKILELREKFVLLYEIYGELVETILEKCSDKMLLYYQDNLHLDVESIKRRKITARSLLEKIDKCLKEFENQLRKIC